MLGRAAGNGRVRKEQAGQGQDSGWGEGWDEDQGSWAGEAPAGEVGRRETSTW